MCSIKETITNHVKDYINLTSQLFESFSFSGKSDPSTIMKLILEKDAQLQLAVKELEKHQRLQEKITKIESEIQTKDKVISDLAVCLREIEKSLEQTIEDASSQLKNLQKTEVGNVDSQELIQYAQLISTTTSAPMDWVPPQLPQNMHLPVPTDDQWRGGWLFNKELQEENKNKVNAILYPHLKQQTVETKDFVLPPGLPPLPAGWKPGDPILGLGLGLPPPPPPGWKPGDPILGLGLPPPPPPGWKPGDPIFDGGLPKKSVNFGLNSDSDEEDEMEEENEELFENGFSNNKPAEDTKPPQKTKNGLGLGFGLGFDDDDDT
eukprot:TRINITY_DN6233_c0_g1_i1.p1 TRINITY_DN6233_c0_g1~~TRINITY_DN6233_c0_g1_i1.p1  ORF type:complete len:321 (-),score=84.96 TRINITY_DN6233_c0_g1_i1:194-1156(-)